MGIKLGTVKTLQYPKNEKVFKKTIFTIKILRSTNEVVHQPQTQPQTQPEQIIRKASYWLTRAS